MWDRVKPLKKFGEARCKTQLIASFLGVLTESGERIREPYDQPVRPSAADSEPSCTKKSSQMPPVVICTERL